MNLSVDRTKIQWLNFSVVNLFLFWAGWCLLKFAKKGSEILLQRETRNEKATIFASHLIVLYSSLELARVLIYFSLLMCLWIDVSEVFAISTGVGLLICSEMLRVILCQYGQNTLEASVMAIKQHLRSYFVVKPLCWKSKICLMLQA